MIMTVPNKIIMYNYKNNNFNGLGVLTETNL